MLAFCFTLIFIFDVAACSQCISHDVTFGGLNYNLFYNCSLPYMEAIDDCESRNMQLAVLKTKDEMNFLSENIVSLGFDNALFWVAHICPAIAVIPDNPDLCLLMTANVTTDSIKNWTTGYAKLTFDCDVHIGWICEDKPDAHRCPAPTSSVSTTTVESVKISSSSSSTTTTTTHVLDTMSSSSSTVRSMTTITSTSNPTSMTTMASAPSTPASMTTTDFAPICNETMKTRIGSHLYQVFCQCYQPLREAASICESHNSTLAVLISQQEVTYLANLTSGQRIGSWSYWVGGLTETDNCSMLMLNQSLTNHVITTRYRISIGYHCTESHPFICKTFIDTFHIKMKLHRSESQEGSVMDYRPTAIFLGSVGIGVLVLILVVVVVIDMPNLVSDVRRAKRRMGQLKSWKKTGKMASQRRQRTSQSKLSS